MREGKKVLEESYILSLERGGGDKISNTAEETFPKLLKDVHSGTSETLQQKRIRISPMDLADTNLKNTVKLEENAVPESPDYSSGSYGSMHSLSPEITGPSIDAQHKTVRFDFRHVICLICINQCSFYFLNLSFGRQQCGLEE